MSKPLYYLVFVGTESHRFDTRRAARVFATLQRLQGRSVILKSVGF